MSTWTNDKCFEAPYLFCADIEMLLKDATTLALKPREENRLANFLGNDGYTRLIVSDGFNHEVIGVQVERGKLALARGLECTVIRDWQGCGLQVSFAWTPENMMDQASQCPEEEEELEDACADETFSGEFRVGNFCYTVKQGLITQRDLVGSIGEGCHSPAAVVSNCNGEIVDLLEGEMPSCGGCN